MKLTPAKVTMLMLVAVASLIGLYVVKGLFATTKPVERPRIVTIPMATGQLTAGTKITDTHIGMGPWPEKELTRDMLRTTRVIIGRVVKETLKAGEPLKGSQLYEPGENAPLQVADGKQAIAINVKNSADIVDGLVKPGNFVDVHFAIDATASGAIDPRMTKLGGISMTLIKGVQVLALNKNFRQGPVLATGNSVTLELAKEQVNVLLVSQAHGTISLTYNADGQGDGGIALNNSDRATLWEVLGLKKPATKEELERDQPFMTESFRGTGSGVSQWGKNGKRFDRAATDADYERRVNQQNQIDNAVDPNDVFESGSSSAGQPSFAPSRKAEPDPDIPAARPEATSGVRSRAGSMLRTRPQSAAGAGPTALRN